MKLLLLVLLYLLYWTTYHVFKASMMHTVYYTVYNFWVSVYLIYTHQESIFSIPHGHESQFGDDFDVSGVCLNEDTRMAVRQSDPVGLGG